MSDGAAAHAVSPRPGDAWRAPARRRTLPEAVAASGPEGQRLFVTFVRRRMCVGADRDAEIEALLRSLPPQPEPIRALWWSGSA